MNDIYQRALECTEQHVQALRASGVRFLNVQAETLADLGRPPVVPALPPVPVATAVSEVRPVELGTQLIAALPVVANVPPPVLPEEQPAPNVTPSVEEKESAMEALRARAANCVKCPHLASTRKNVVFGVGDIHSPLMFIGEAPGADEDQQGEPFVGVAGQLLTRIINTMGFSRQTVYIANILKCRPDTPGQLTGNRKPTPDEMRTCLPYLLAQIDIIKPRVIVALGVTAVEGLFGKCEGINKLRGTFRMFRDIPLMPTYHPAYLLRNQALTEKRKVWEDMLKVLEKLDRPISEKQRGYFLKA